MEDLWKHPWLVGVLSGMIAAITSASVFCGICQEAEVESSGRSIAYTAAGLGLTIGLAMFWISYVYGAPTNSEAKEHSQLEIFFAGAGPIAALTFFIYQAVAGALFATTSVKLAHEKSLSDEHSCVLQITLERGDNWLVDIDWVGIALGDNLPDRREKWHAVPFPRTMRGRTRLAPREVTGTMHAVPWPADLLGKDVVVTVTVKVVSYAVLWPVPGRSVARIIVRLPSATTSDTSGAVA